MSENKQRWAWADADLVAKAVVAQLTFYCERILVVGSVRRRKGQVGDVEVLFIPRMESRQADMFTSEPFDLASDRIETLRATGWLAKRNNVNGTPAGWGLKNKLAVHVESGMPVDLFAENSMADWWRSVIIRTGPKDSNINLITTAARHGVLVHAYGAGLTDAKTGVVIPCSSEEEFFDICHVQYKSPECR